MPFSISVPLDTFKPDRLKKMLTNTVKSAVRHVADEALSSVLRKTGIRVSFSGYYTTSGENRYSSYNRYSRGDEMELLNLYGDTNGNGGENAYDGSDQYSRDIRQSENTFLDRQNNVRVWGSSPSDFPVTITKPYQWVNLTDARTTKEARKFDTWTTPSESIKVDANRIGNFMSSERGKLFIDSQKNLQKLNAFTETRVWNESEILDSVSRTASTKLAIRHSNSSGTVPGIATDALSNGSSTSAISNSSQLSGVAQYGFVRGETGNRARTSFSTKWTPKSVGSSQVQNETPSTTSRHDADWKIRPEYTSDDTNVFRAFLSDERGLLSYSVPNRPDKYTSADIYKYTSTTPYNPSNGVVRFPSTAEPDTSNGKLQGRAIANQKKLASGNFDPNKVDEKDVGIKRDIRTMSTESSKEDVSTILNGGKNTGYEANLKAAIARWSDGYKVDEKNFYSGGQRTYTERSKYAADRVPGTAKSYYDRSKKGILETKKLFGGAQQSDAYNSSGIVAGSNVKTSMIYQVGGSTTDSTDQIFFYFHDIVNDKYIPFRATLTGINENTSVKWEDVQYMGRADTLFTYNGFTRDFNFAFTVYAGSVKELIPMWNRVNYLSGLTRPAKYTKGGDTVGTQVMSGFIYPPLIKIRIGDLFVDQPGVIISLGLTVPDDTTWETVRLNNEDYTYLEGTHQEIRIGNTTSRQLPMKVDISVSMRLLEKERSETGNNLYFDPINI